LPGEGSTDGLVTEAGNFRRKSRRLLKKRVWLVFNSELRKETTRKKAARGAPSSFLAVEGMT